MSAPTDAPQERVDLLDPELQAAYNATPWVKLSNASVPMIRSAGGVSKPIAIPDEVEVIEVEDGSVAGMLYKKRGGQEDAPLVVWNHGGGYIFGFPALHASLYVQFVLDFGASVFAVKYPLAPEHPFPAANEAAIEAWKWATTGGIAKYGLKPQRGRVALGGTSAGASLTLFADKLLMWHRWRSRHDHCSAHSRQQGQS